MTWSTSSARTCPRLRSFGIAPEARFGIDSAEPRCRGLADERLQSSLLHAVELVELHAEPALSEPANLRRNELPGRRSAELDDDGDRFAVGGDPLRIELHPTRAHVDDGRRLL